MMCHSRNQQLLSWQPRTRPWYGKILLAGEYTMTHTSCAFILPLHCWPGRWQKNPGGAAPAWLKFGAWAAQQNWPWWNQKKWQAEYPSYHLVSKLPQGVGLGSSGALCAALYDRYRTDSDPCVAGEVLRQRLASLEAYFHGTSSGLDPLISLLNRPGLLRPTAWQFGDSAVAAVTLAARPGPQKDPYFIFLWDSHLPRQTLGLMDFYQQAYQQQASWVTALAQAQGRLVDALAAGGPARSSGAALAEAWQELSQQQLAVMSLMIPPPVRSLWQGPGYWLKLCGKGGGGFFLGLATSTADLRPLKQNGKLWYLRHEIRKNQN